MHSSSYVDLAIFGKPLNLVQLLRKEIKFDGIKIVEKETQNTKYKIITIDPSDPDNSHQSLEQDISTNSPDQKVLVILLVDSFTPQGLLDPILLKLNLKQNEASSNMRTIIALDLYGPDNQEFISHFEEYLYQVLLKKEISVSNKGNFSLFPLSVSDLIKASAKSLFSRSTKGELFCVGGEELKDLDLAYLLKSSLSEKGIDIDLNTTNADKNPFCSKNDLVEAQAKLNWLPKDSLTSDFKKLLNKLNSDIPRRFEPEKPIQKMLHKIKLKPKKNLPPNDDTVIQTTKRGLNSFFKSVIISLAIFSLFPVLLFGTFFSLNANFLYRSYQEFRQSDITKARSSLKLSRVFHQYAGFWFKVIVPITAPIIPTTTKDINNFYLLLDHAGDFLTSVYDSYALSNRYYQDLIGKSDSNSPQILNAINLSLDSPLDNLSQIQLLTNQSKLPFGIKTRLQDPAFLSQIQVLKKQLYSGASLVDLLQKISQKKEPIKILVIVQDENELRGSGGFLNTVIQITLINNKITDYQVEPALRIDKLIDGRVEPPKIIITALGQNNWFFRDTNLNGSFPETAAQVAWFYNRFKSTPVAGVLAVNSSFFKSLLKDLGPLTLANGQMVAADNLPILLSSLTVDPQNDILTSLSESFMAKLKLGEIPFIPLARALSKEIEDRNLSLWFDSTDLESSVPQEIVQKPEVIPCHPQLYVFDCKQNLIYLNENNLSINKLNLYLRRDQSHQVEISNTGEVAYNLSYQYTYPIPAPNNLNQAYNAYYQLYLSPWIKLKTILLDEKELPLNQISESLTGVRKYDFYLPQTINQSHNLNLNLVSSLSKSQQTPFSVYFQKQPGTNDSLKFELKFPVFFSPKLLTTPLQNSASNTLTGSFKALHREAIGVLFKSAW